MSLTPAGELENKTPDHGATIREIFMRAASEMPINADEIDLISDALERAIVTMKKDPSILTTENINNFFTFLKASQSADLKKQALIQSQGLIGLDEDIDTYMKRNFLDLIDHEKDRDVVYFVQTNLDAIQSARIERISSLANSLPKLAQE